MTYKAKDMKELKALQKPSRRARLDVEVEGGSQVVDKLEKQQAKLQAKITELETIHRNIMKRIFELETRVENLRMEG